MKKLLFSFFLMILSFSPFIFSQEFSAELRGEFERWDVGKFGGISNGIIGGAGLAVYHDAYFAGGGFSIGEYNVKNDADKTIQRNDIDLVIGKKIDDQWSVFTGYRYNRFNARSIATPASDTTENIVGLGIGTSYSQTFTSKWVGIVSGVVSGLYSYNNFDDAGKGYSVGMEAGILRIINRKVSITARVKTQFSKLTYDLSSNWTQSYNRIGVNLSYAF